MPALETLSKVEKQTPSRKGIGGPKTAEGKARVSLNAMKHGLSAKSSRGLRAIAKEVGTTYEEILDEMRTHYHPMDMLEDRLVQKIARCFWRIQITQMMEDRVLSIRGARMHGPGESYEKIMRHERLIDIQLHKAIAALEKKRKEEAKQKLQNKLEEERVGRLKKAQYEHKYGPIDTRYKSFKEVCEIADKIAAMPGDGPPDTGPYGGLHPQSAEADFV